MSSLFRGSDWYGALVLRIDTITPHPDQETTALEVARVMAVDGDPLSGITVVVKKGEFVAGQLAVYTGIDAIVPTANSPRFGFLDPRGKPHKLKAKKLRGVFSEGLLTPARALDDVERAQEAAGKLVFTDGADLTVVLGVTKFITDGEAEPAEYELVVRGPSLAETSDLTSWLFQELTKSEQGPAWVWITSERIASAIKAGACSVNGKVVLKTCSLSPGDEVKITVFPTNARSNRPGGSVLSGLSEHCPIDHKVPKYDLDALRKWGSGVFVPGETVVGREKLHGANARFVHDGQRLWVATRTRWTKRPDDQRKDTWWLAAARYGLEEKLAKVPGVVFYGEVFGQVQDLKYGSKPGDVFLAVFDALVLPEAPLESTEWPVGWLNDAELTALCAKLELPMAPLVYEGPWDADVVYALRNGPSLWEGADHTREGVVVRPKRERQHPRLGRVVLKLVGEDYKLRR